MKHLNEILDKETKKLTFTTKQLSTKLREANKGLKLATMEQLADHYKIEKLENEVDSEKEDTLDRMLREAKINRTNSQLNKLKNDRFIFQVAYILSIILFLISVILTITTCL